MESLNAYLACLARMEKPLRGLEITLKIARIGVSLTLPNGLWMRVIVGASGGETMTVGEAVRLDLAVPSRPIRMAGEDLAQLVWSVASYRDVIRGNEARFGISPISLGLICTFLEKALEAGSFRILPRGLPPVFLPEVEGKSPPTMLDTAG